MVVLMDIVHSHASKNTMDGINMFDGGCWALASGRVSLGAQQAAGTPLLGMTGLHTSSPV